MKLLIVEDEKNLQNLMVQYLKRVGYLCEIADTYSEGYKKINNFNYDCIIIDLNLPGGDGLTLVQLLREDKTQSGIIITSARVSQEEKIMGLDYGADDYLTKPFNLPELNARIKAVMRRKSDVFTNTLSLGEIMIDLDSRTLSVSSIDIPLTKKEFDILLFLVRNKNRVITKDSIAEYLWGDYMDNADSYDFIYAHMKNIRKKLAQKGCGDYIRTIYGIGYKFQVV